jgi:hypothetical protein
MSKSRKRRQERKARLKRKQQRRAGGTPSNARFCKLDIHREIGYVTGLAQAEDSRIVAIGNLVLFSTRTRDAWLLDCEDGFALPVCRDGEPQPFRIIDAPDTFAIEWTARFAIEGEAFVVHEESGRVVVMHGYPTAAIAAACQGLGGNRP